MPVFCGSSPNPWLSPLSSFPTPLGNCTIVPALGLVSQLLCCVRSPPCRGTHGHRPWPGARSPPRHLKRSFPALTLTCIAAESLASPVPRITRFMVSLAPVCRNCPPDYAPLPVGRSNCPSPQPPRASTPLPDPCQGLHSIFCALGAGAAANGERSYRKSWDSIHPCGDLFSSCVALF